MGCLVGYIFPQAKSFPQRIIPNLTGHYPQTGPHSQVLGECWHIKGSYHYPGHYPSWYPEEVTHMLVWRNMSGGAVDVTSGHAQTWSLVKTPWFWLEHCSMLFYLFACIFYSIKSFNWYYRCAMRILLFILRNNYIEESRPCTRSSC